MAGSLLTQSLVRFVNPDVPGFQVPFNMLVNGVKWSLATDRSCVVAVKGWGDYKQPVWEESRQANRIEVFTAYLNATVPEGAISVPLVDLVTWATQPCENNYVIGRVLGLPMDTRRLAKILQDLPFKTVHIWDASEVTKVMCLGISAGGGSWKAFLAGFPLDEEGDTADVEDFDPTCQQDIFSIAMSS
jgi:hypothetical protein